MFRLIRWFSSIIVFVILLVVADRVAVRVAQEKIANVVQDDADLRVKPHVVVHGFPFLTQAVAGNYKRITVTANDLFGSVASGTETGNGATLVLDLHSVKVPLSKVITSDVHAVTVSDLDGEVDASFADLASAAHIPGLTLTPASQANEVIATETLTLGEQTFSSTITATVIASLHSIKVHPVKISVPDGSPSAEVVDELLAKGAFKIPIPGLPADLQLGQISVGAQGVALPLHQTGVVMTR
jgi:hypothetical protein